MDILSDDSILEIITNISNFNDLENLCKSSKRIKDICKTRKLTICKSFLQNNGYVNFDDITEGPCKLMVELRKLPNLDKGIIKQFIDDPDKKNLLRFLSINGKIDEILYDICYEEIGKHNFNNIKKLHQITNYNFENPENKESLVLSAAFTKNVRILKYILDNGGKIYEDELSLVKNTGAREFIKGYPQSIKKNKPYELSYELSKYFGFV